MLETIAVEAEYPSLSTCPEEPLLVLKDAVESKVVQTIVLVVALRRDRCARTPTAVATRQIARHTRETDHASRIGQKTEATLHYRRNWRISNAQWAYSR